MGRSGMERRLEPASRRYREAIEGAAAFIESHQLSSGAIPCTQDGVTDPWDLVECAIALDLCGRSEQAAKAYRWLRQRQNPDGSWHYAYLGDQPQDRAKDSNHSAYVATGVWRHYLATGNDGFLTEMWPTVEGGVQFSLGLQQLAGEVYWARDAGGDPWPGALLTGSSCIWQSVSHGIAIADKLGYDREHWRAANARLERAIRERPWLFDRHGENARGYAMNWYYPVLCGVLPADEASRRLGAAWDEFVVEGWGCKCSLDQPWVTVAETCELALALTAVGQPDKAATLVDWVLQLADGDGGFWTGINVEQQVVYPPGEKTTWTAAAAVMAMVALAGQPRPGGP
ncbi:MAG: prenyltransferase/squalene oxidase repeat-containing protein [Dehalococcoidia bacterium]